MSTFFLLFFVLLTGFSGFFLGNPGLLFSMDEGKLWFAARSCLLAVLLAAFVSMLVAVVTKWKDLKPYFLKFKKYGSMLKLLVKRDFLAKYKRSVLGVLWSLLNPLLTMLILTIVFSFLFRFDIENFPVYLLSGQIIFTLFNETTNLCMNSVLGAAAMMKKVNVPKYIFPLSRALSCLINFVFSLTALVLVMLITKAPFHMSMLYIPIAVFYAFVFSLGIGLILSAAVVFFRDISYLYGILMTAVTYLTPLFYPISIVPDQFRWLISLNPLYHLVECFRTCAIYGGIPDLWQNTVCGLVAFASLGIGLYVFYHKQDDFILHI